MSKLNINDFIKDNVMEENNFDLNSTELPIYLGPDEVKLINIIKILKKEKKTTLSELNKQLQTISENNFKITITTFLETINKELIKHKKKELTEKEFRKDFGSFLYVDNRINLKRLKHLEIDGYLILEAKENDYLISLPKNIDIVEIPNGKEIIIEGTRIILPEPSNNSTTIQDIHIKLPIIDKKIIKVINTDDYKIVSKQKN